jgi:ribose 1,5-bisphosphate isomerase
MYPDKFYSVVEGIRTMKIRGAGRIAREAVKALKLVSENIDLEDRDKYISILRDAAKKLVDTRPTAVSLPNGLRYVLNRVLQSYESGASVEEMKSVLVESADNFIKSSLQAIKKIGKYGAGRIEDGDIIMTHCNSQSALSVIVNAYRMGKNIRVYATETRPRFQGRITVKVLNKEGIDVTMIVDSAMRYFINKVNKVVVGADAIAANGAVVNKIGTSLLALAANEARVPFMVAAETYKFSPDTLFGKLIIIEERDYREVAPESWVNKYKHLTIRNPAFDVTPPEYIDILITEIGVFSPSVFPLVVREMFGSFYSELEPWEK